MDAVCNVGVHAGTSSSDIEAAVALNLTVSGFNEKLKVDTKVEAHSTGKQCLKAKIDVTYENGQQEPVQQLPGELGPDDGCKNSKGISEDENGKLDNSHAGLCEMEICLDKLGDHSNETENAPCTYRPHYASENDEQTDFEDVAHNLNVSEDVQDGEEKGLNIPGKIMEESNQSDDMKNDGNIHEENIGTNSSSNDFIVSGIDKSGETNGNANTVEETNALLQNIVNQTHVVEEVNMVEEIDVDNIAKEINIADDSCVTDSQNSETFICETRRMPGNKEEAKCIAKKVGRPKKSKIVANKVGRPKKVVQKTAEKDFSGQNFPKRGRPKKSETLEKITQEEPCLKKRRTNNSMSVGLDNNEKDSIEYFSLRNAIGNKKFSSRKQDGDNVEHNENNDEKEEEYSSNNIRNVQDNNSVGEHTKRVKLKELEVSLTKVDITRYKTAVEKEFDKGETRSTKRGRKSSLEMNKKGKNQLKTKFTKSVTSESDDLAPILPKYKLDYTFEKKVVDGRESKIFFCKHCNYTTRLKCAIVKHFSIHSVPPHACQYCDFKTRSLKGFQEHEAKHTKEKPFKCEKCEYSCRYRVDLYHHQAKHLDEKKFRCPHEGCNFITKWKKNISHHVKSHNTTRPFACHLCSMTFKRRQTLKNHLFRHNDVKPKKCDECGFRCKSNYELRMHKLKHSDVRPYPCTFPGCEQRCKVKSDLVKHMRIHSKVKNVLCSLCGKGFKSLADCNKHQKRHSDVRPFGCDICGKFFRFIQGLKQHLRNHQGIKPFQCDTCGHLFSNKSNRDKHAETHNYDERPFRCPLCPYGAKNKDHLLAHIGTMHGQSYAFFCELCKKPFQRYFQLITHHSRMHTKAELSKFMSSIGVNMEDAQKEIKVEMVEEGLISREEIGQMQVTLQQQQRDIDREEEDQEQLAALDEDDGEQSTENTRKEQTENTTSDNTAISMAGDTQVVEEEVDDTITARKSLEGNESENSLNRKTSEEGSVPVRQIIKQEPTEHVNVSATLAIYDGFRLPLFTRGFEFNPDKSGKKPRCWFMEMDNMPEDIKWHQERYFSRIETYEAKRARVAEMKRIYDETGEVVKIDGRKGARKRKKRIEVIEADDDLESILADICEDVPSSQITEKPTKGINQSEVSKSKKPRGRPPKSKPKEDHIDKDRKPKKRGRPPRTKVADRIEKPREMHPGGKVDEDEEYRGTPPKERAGEKENSGRRLMKRKNCKNGKSTQTKGMRSKKKKLSDIEKNLNRKNEEYIYDLKNKRQWKSTNNTPSVTTKGVGLRKRKVITQKKSRLSEQKKGQVASKANDEIAKPAAKCNKKVPPIRLRLQKKNKKPIWKCETKPNKISKGSNKEVRKISTKPSARKGKQKRPYKKSTSRKKNLTKEFVIDWETEEQIGVPPDSNLNEQNEINFTEIKEEITEEVQNDNLGTDFHANSECLEDEPKDQIPKPIASFYCDDVILMKNSRESLKVLQTPPGFSVLGIENSTSRLGTVTNVEQAVDSAKQHEDQDVVMGSSSKVCVYRNPEISDLSDIMKMHSDDLIQDLCVAQELHSDIKTEPI